MSLEAHSWGISDTEFLMLFGIVCGVYVLVAGSLGRLHTGRRRSSSLTEPADPLELAMLTDGSVCVLTAAAARLHQIGALRIEHGRLFASGDNDDAANDVERELVQALRRSPGATAADLRRTLLDGPVHVQMAAKLAAHGLLRAPWRTVCVRRLQNFTWALAGVSFVRFVWAAVDPPDGPMSTAAVQSLCIGLFLPTIVYFASGRKAPGISPAGRRLLQRERDRHPELRAVAAPKHQIALAVALFGSEPLRISDPDLAAAWGILSPDEAKVEAAMLG